MNRRAVIWLMFLFVTCSAQAQTETWPRWIGWKFGTTITYPAARFTPLPEPDAHDGRIFVARDGARIAAFAYFNVGQSIESIDASLRDSPDHGRITYRKRLAHAVVTSGFRAIEGREHIFYEKYFLEPGGEVVHAIVITYPADTERIYDPLIRRIVEPLETSAYKPPR